MQTRSKTSLRQALGALLCCCGQIFRLELPRRNSVCRSCREWPVDILVRIGKASLSDQQLVAFSAICKPVHLGLQQLLSDRGRYRAEHKKFRLLKELLTSTQTDGKPYSKDFLVVCRDEDPLFILSTGEGSECQIVTMSTLEREVVKGNCEASFHEQKLSCKCEIWGNGGGCWRECKEKYLQEVALLVTEKDPDHSDTYGALDKIDLG